MLVVSAGKGEFEGGFADNGQTKEHAILAKSLVRSVAVRAIRPSAQGSCAGFLRLCGGKRPRHCYLLAFSCCPSSQGVRQLVVAVNKLDAVDPAWSKGRFDEIHERVLSFLVGVCLP